MKRYFAGLFALTTALALAALETSHRAKTWLADFEFLGDPTVQSEVEDVSYWREASELVACSGADEEACRINDVIETYWHLDGSDNKVLNVSSWDGEFGDSGMIIYASSFYSMGLTTYYVCHASSYGMIVNKWR